MGDLIFNPRLERTELPTGKTAKCKRCGSVTTTWQQGKTGSWYLTEVFISTEGDYTIPFTNKVWFHSMFCESGEYNHEVAQAEFDFNAEQERIRGEELTKQREERFAAENAQRYTQMILAPEHERRERLAQLERVHQNYLRNPPTMDYFAEFCREEAAAKVRIRDMKILRATLGMDSE